MPVCTNCCQNLKKLKRNRVQPETSEPEEYEYEEEDEEYNPQILTKALFLIYLLGRASGILPLHTKNGKLLCEWKSFAFVFSASFVLLFTLNFVAESIGVLINMAQFNEQRFVENVVVMLYLSQSYVSRVLFIVRAPQLKKLYETGLMVEKAVCRYKIFDDVLIVMRTRFQGSVGITMILISILTFDLNIMVKSEHENFFCAYGQAYVNPLFRDSCWFGVYTSILDVFLYVSWYFTDAVILVLSTYIGYLFWRYNNLIEDINPDDMALIQIDEIRDCHRLLALFVEQVDSALSPLILMSQITSMGFILSEIYLGFLKGLFHPKFFVQWYTGITFFFELLRLFYPALMAAKFHDRAHQATNIVRSWPSWKEGDTIDDAKFRISAMCRFTLELQEPQIAFSGWGFFIITRTFLTGLVSGIITFNIVILQFKR